jgi:hypothetical protein
VIGHQLFVSSPLAHDMLGLERTDLHYCFEEAEHGTPAATASYDALFVRLFVCLFFFFLLDLGLFIFSLLLFF